MAVAVLLSTVPPDAKATLVTDPAATSAAVIV